MGKKSEFNNDCQEIKTALLKSEEQYKTLIQTIPDIIYELDVNGYFTFVSNSILQYGYTPEELIGKHFEEIIHPADFKLVNRSKVLSQYLGKKTGEANPPKLFDERRTGNRMTKNLEVRLKLKNNVKDFCYTEIYAAGKWDTPSVGDASKISVQTYSYAEVHSSGKWDKDVHNKNKIFLGSIGIIRDISNRKKIEEELKKSKEELEQKVRERTAELTNSNQKLKDEIFGRKKIEKKIQIMNEELSRANEELKTLDKLKTNLLCNVSHELRTPLVAIRGYIEMILSGRSGTINQKQSKQLAISLKCADRLVTLIDNLLDFSKIELGRDKLNIETFDINEVLIEAFFTIKPKANANEISLFEEIYAEHAYINGDKKKIYQVFLNLFDNAVKFTRPGGKITLEVKIIPDEKVIISVTDTGVGISETEIEKIFDRFYQVDSSPTRQFGGMGIGLAISKDIIKLHNGEIKVKSKKDAGTTFIVMLPLSKSSDIKTDKSCIEKSESINDKIFNDIKILIVDDVPEIIEYMNEILISEKFKTFIAKSGTEALKIVKEEDVDLILLDVAMDDIDGLDLCRIIRKNPATKNICIIIVTAVAEATIKKQSEEAGADGFILKPFKMDELITEIKKVLDKKQMPSQSVDLKRQNADAE